MSNKYTISVSSFTKEKRRSYTNYNNICDTQTQLPAGVYMYDRSADPDPWWYWDCLSPFANEEIEVQECM